MQTNTSINKCCCSCGFKKSICIIKNMKDLIDSSTVYYSCGYSSGSIKDSKYPNFILLEKDIAESGSSNEKLYINLCIDDINFIKIVPKDSNYQLIINELNSQYVSPLVINTNCNENCCCKDSVISYLKDKYLECDPVKRQFHMYIKDSTNNKVPLDLDSSNSVYTVSVTHLDYDIVWVLDSINKIIYLVSLCNICGLVD